jgi:hypothetical protein
VTDRALEEHHHDAVERLIDLLRQPEETAGSRNDEAAIAGAAMLGPRLALAREQQRGDLDP